MSYYQKYLKYKTKYLNLHNQMWCAQTAGGQSTARNFFIQTLSSPKNEKIYKDFLENLKNDITFDNIDITETTDINKIFDQIYKSILNKYYTNKQELDKNIDFIIYSYIYGTFGEPNSFGNINELKTLIEDYNLLESRNLNSMKLDAIKKNGLLELKKYIDSNLDKLTKIKEEIEKEKRWDTIRREMVKEGPMEPLFKTDTVYIYEPTTERQSQYYGQHTKWCTAGFDDCDFDDYRRAGSLYIIMTKTKPIRKVQLQIESSSLMDETDTPISFPKMMELFNNDPKLLEWLDEKYKKYYLDIFKVKHDKRYGNLIKLDRHLNLYESYPKTSELEESVLQYYKTLSPELMPSYIIIATSEKSLRWLSRINTNILNNIKYVDCIFRGEIFNLIMTEKYQEAQEVMKKELHKLIAICDFFPNMIELSLFDFDFDLTISNKSIRKFNNIYGPILTEVFNKISLLNNFCKLRFTRNIPVEIINSLPHNFKIVNGFE